MEESVWCGGGETTLSGVYFNPNMPTEECYTSPDKFSAEGVVYSTKPLSVMGNLVDNFGFRFEKGKAVEVHALKSDSKYLGFTKLAELALNHELKAKENDLEYVKANFESLMNKLNGVLAIIKKYI